VPRTRFLFSCTFRHGLSIASASMTPNYSSMFPFSVNQQRKEKLGSISCLIELILMLVGWSSGNIWNFLIAFSGCSREEASLIIFMDGWSCCCGSIRLAFLFLFSRPGVFFPHKLMSQLFHLFYLFILN
jgi:hypothetical protein